MTFFLFPGQGSQTPGMAKDFYENSDAARAVFDEAASVVDSNLLRTMFEGPEEALRDTRAAQVALVLAGVAIARHLEAGGIQPDGAAGHSIGEIAALCVAGSLGLHDALKLTQERARLMAEESPEGTMAAVIGMAPEAVVDALPEGAEVANFNGPQQTIISGTLEGVEAAVLQLKEAGAKRVLPLKVSGPFHSTCMNEAALGLKEYLADVPIQEPALRFVSSVTGAVEHDPETIRELLWKQLYSAVRWTDVMETLGEVEAFEVGPGKVLQGIAKRIDGGPTVMPAGTLEQADSILKV